MVVQTKCLGVKGEVVTLGSSYCGFGSKFVSIFKRIALVAKHVGQAKLGEKSCILIIACKSCTCWDYGIFVEGAPSVN